MESKQEQTQLSQDKAVKTYDQQKCGDFCLVCFSKVDRSKLPKQRSLLSSNLNVIFLLRKVLQVPSELLIGNFKKCGSPAYWISLCENCSQLTAQAMEQHLQILKLVNQLRSILKLITDKMRDSSVLSTETFTSYQVRDEKESMQEKRLDILKRTREFVTNYNYNTHLVNPFVEGDKLARELDGKLESSSSSEEEDSEEEGSAVQSAESGDDGEGGLGEQEEADDKMEEEIEAPFQDNLSSDGRVRVDGKWKCRFCDKLFEMKYNLRTHENGRHPSVPGQFKCKICGKGINSVHYLQEHLRKTHKIDATGNTIEIKSRAELEDKKKDERRKRTAHVEVDGKWKCRHCEKTFWSKSAVHLHENSKHAQNVAGKLDWECAICGKRLSGKSYLLSHRRQAHKLDADGNAIEIEVLKKVRERNSEEGSKRRRRASSRLPVVPVDGKWKCRHCDKEFKNRKSFRSHEQEQHPSVPGQFSCDICGAAKNSRFGLLLHRRHYHQVNSAGNPILIKPRKRKKRGEKPADPSTCHLCGKSFGWMDQLRKHIKYVHEKQFDVKCEICGLGVCNKYTLTVHLLTTHKDEPVTLKLVDQGVKLWKCGVVGCRANYLKESRLEEHTKKVHGNGEEKDAQKRFTCSFCGKTFWYWHTLKVHERSHKSETEKPYSCELCGAKFKMKSSIRRHKTRFHPAKNG